MELTLTIPDESAARLQASGVEISVFVEEMLAREAVALSRRPANESVSAAVDRILQRRKSLTLGGLKIRDLIDEGRKY